MAISSPAVGLTAMPIKTQAPNGLRNFLRFYRRIELILNASGQLKMANRAVYRASGMEL